MSKEGKKFRSALYDVDPQKSAARSKNKSCPKCGRAMALHRRPVPRWHCGYCSYVEIVRS
ncbi:MAG: 30S ribosomal protein S27ae [Sulfolobales archaeon]